jgi:D-alanine-D-alanine ligase
MRIGLLTATKRRFPREQDDPADIDSEVLSEFEEDALLSGLRDAGHHVIQIPDPRSLLTRISYWRRKCDLVFNVFCGYRGVERKLGAPAILDLAGIPYIGSPPYVHALTRHKYHAKLVVAAGGVPTPHAVMIPPAGLHELRSVAYPAIVKPVAESSAIGISAKESIVSSPSEALLQGERLAARYRQPALVESFVSGAEVEVPLFIASSPRPLGTVAITLDGTPIGGGQFLTSAIVYDDRYGFSAPPSFVDVERVLPMATRAAAILGLRDYGRIDFRISQDGTPWFLEASSHPHLQIHSSFNWLAEQRHQPYHALLDEIIQIAARRAGLF